MAAVTEANRYEAIEGNQRVVYATLTIAANGDTWATGLGHLVGWNFTPTTAADCGATVSGGTVTLVTGGALTVQARVAGS